MRPDDTKQKIVITEVGGILDLPLLHPHFSFLREDGLHMRTIGIVIGRKLRESSEDRALGKRESARGFCEIGACCLLHSMHVLSVRDAIEVEFENFILGVPPL